MIKYKYRQQIIIGDKLHDVKAKTKKELNDKIKKLKRDFQSVKRHEPTVEQWIDQSLQIYKPGISQSALTGYRSKCKRHIIPYIGQLYLSDVTPTQCQSVVAAMIDYATDTQRKVKQLLFFIFDSAIRAGYINDNPAARTTKPSQKPSLKRRALTDDEKQKVLQTIPKRSGYIIYGFMLFCGCRPSEASNIRYDDIDNGRLHIRGTKTCNADRYVPVPDLLQDILPTGTGYIATDHRGNPMSASTRRRLWLQFRIDAGLSPDIVPYSLRHTYATTLYSAHVDIRLSARLLGHASIATTNDIYTHIRTDDIDQSAQLINDYLNKNTSKSSDNFQEILLSNSSNPCNRLSQEVKTWPSHGQIMGSIPVGGTNYETPRSR